MFPRKAKRLGVSAPTWDAEPLAGSGPKKHDPAVLFQEGVPTEFSGPTLSCSLEHNKEAIAAVEIKMLTLFTSNLPVLGSMPDNKKLYKIFRMIAKKVDALPMLPSTSSGTDYS